MAQQNSQDGLGQRVLDFHKSLLDHVRPSASFLLHFSPIDFYDLYNADRFEAHGVHIKPHFGCRAAQLWLGKFEDSRLYSCSI